MELWNTFWHQLLATTWLEATAVVFGILSVWFSRQENILVFPTGIVSVLLYVYLTYQYKLYADSAVNFYYFVLSVYGWYHWTDTGGTAPQIPITRNSNREHSIALVLFVVAFLLFSKALILFTDSDVPRWDAFTTSAAVVAMWLMARKKIEHWLYWIICNASSIPLYIYKGLPFTAFQFVVFGVLAVMGLISWKRKLTNP
jgi:nicotinamide mononucleotide transporter